MSWFPGPGWAKVDGTFWMALQDTSPGVTDQTDPVPMSRYSPGVAAVAQWRSKWSVEPVECVAFCGRTLYRSPRGVHSWNNLAQLGSVQFYEGISQTTWRKDAQRKIAKRLGSACSLLQLAGWHLHHIWKTHGHYGRCEAAEDHEISFKKGDMILGKECFQPVNA